MQMDGRRMLSVIFRDGGQTKKTETGRRENQLSIDATFRHHDLKWKEQICFVT